MTLKTKARLVTATTLGDVHAERIDYASLPPGANLAIGASIDTWDFTITGRDYVTFDPAKRDLAWLHGLAFNGANDRLIVSTAGRYHILVNILLENHATKWRHITVSPPSLSDGVLVSPLPQSLGGPAYTAATLEVYIELDPGAEIWVYLEEAAVRAETTFHVPEMFLQVQYVGPKTGAP